MNPSEKYNVFDLGAAHKTLLGKYLTFFKTKQDTFIKETKMMIEDFKTDNVKDMMYSNQDIQDMFERMKEDIAASMDKEISYYLNMNAIFVQLLLHDADKQNANLKVETSQVENINNVQEMDEFIKSVVTVNIPGEFGKHSVISKLTSISKTQNLISDYESLKHEFDILTEKYSILKNQNSMLIQENQNLNSESSSAADEINLLRNQIKDVMTKTASQSNIDSVTTLNKLQTEVESTKKKLNEQVIKYQTLLGEFDTKVSESVQFKQLKKLLQEKNVLIVELKSKVAKMEDEKEEVDK